LTSALAAWREALELLPIGTRQHEVIVAKITDLVHQLPANSPGVSTSSSTQTAGMRTAAGLGALGLLLWKFKALAAGLTKSSTFFSMLLSLGVYWTAWGWKFAAGLVISIYIHEMGHVLT
jgi:hypothetical protein